MEQALQAANWRDYLELTKPKVVALMLLTAVIGMFMAVPGLVPWQALVFGNLGLVIEHIHLGRPAGHEQVDAPFRFRVKMREAGQLQDRSGIFSIPVHGWAIEAVEKGEELIELLLFQRKDFTHLLHPLVLLSCIYGVQHESAADHRAALPEVSQ